MLVLNPAEIDAISSSTQKIGFFFRLASEPVVRLWLGTSNCRVGITAEDAHGAVYTGFGILDNVPVLQQLINGRADRVSFQISGVSKAALKQASIDAAGIYRKPLALGFGLFGGDWQQLGVPKWFWRGIADVVTLHQEEIGDGVSRTIDLSVGSRFTSRRRRGLSFLTNHDQQLRSPGDRFCERTANYSQDVDKVWPRFS